MPRVIKARVESARRIGLQPMLGIAIALAIFASAFWIRAFRREDASAVREIVFCVLAEFGLAPDHAGTDALQVESWHVMMERPGVTGPFRAEARVNGAASSRIAVAATLHDEGKDDRAISTSMAIFQRV